MVTVFFSKSEHPHGLATEDRYHVSITKKEPLAILDATFIGTPREVYSEVTEEKPERELIGWDANVSEIDCGLPATEENAKTLFGILQEDQPDETVDMQEAVAAFERALPPPQPEPLEVYSKLKIYQMAATLGFWDALETWMKQTTVESINIYEAWLTAQVISNDYPRFAEILEAVSQVIGKSVAEIKQILKRCIADEAEINAAKEKGE